MSKRNLMYYVHFKRISLRIGFITIYFESYILKGIQKVFISVYSMIVHKLI